MSDPEHNYIDHFHQHEAMHMSLFLAEAVEAQLVEHAYIKASPKCVALANKAAEALQELYQLIGQQKSEL